MRPSVDRLVTRLFAAYASGERAEIEPLLDASVVVKTLDGRVLRGRERAADVVDELRTPEARTSFTVHAIRGDDECVLVSGRRRVTGRQGHSDAPAHWVLRFADGMLLEATSFASREEAERMYPVLC
jgi:ketosteroid isomerase-like protein